MKVNNKGMIDMKIIDDLKYNSGYNSFLDIYLPEIKEYDVLIWFHRGGLEGESRKSIMFAEDLTRLGIAVVSVEYRLYPDAKYPEYIEDCAAAVKFTLEHMADYGGVKRFFTSGQSAGAYITMMLCFNPTFLHKAGVDRSKISGYISESAQVTTHFNVLKERGIDPRLERIDHASPIFYLCEESDFDNLLMIYYSEDIPCRPEENRLFYTNIKRLCPDKNVKLVELSGNHCNGSTNRNEKGNFDFNDALVKFING